jgi:DNA-binding CsgD family transcriptional regulator
MQGAEAVFAALGALGYGCVLLDNVGRVLRTNDKAVRYLGVSLELRGRVDDEDGSQDQAVQMAIRDALRTASVVSPRLGYIVAVDRESRRPLLLRSVQLAEDGIEGSVGSTAAVVLLDPEDYPQPDELLLSQMFRLTPAECRLAQRLSRGQSLQEISDGLKIGIGTARMQLKSVFWKTGTRRQGELVALLSQLARLGAMCSQ